MRPPRADDVGFPVDDGALRHEDRSSSWGGAVSVVEETTQQKRRRGPRHHDKLRRKLARVNKRKVPKALFSASTHGVCGALDCTSRTFGHSWRSC